MATQIIRPTNREEWLDVRKSGIGSSEVARREISMTLCMIST